LDLSVGSVAMLSGILAIRLESWGLAPSLFVAMFVGVVVGLGQGYVISRLGINSMVLTIGTSILIGGIAWLAAGGQAVVLTDFTSSDFLLTRWWIFSPASLTGLLVLSLIGVFLARLRLGREVYAVGGARQEATAAGVPIRKTMTVAFAISGGCAALAGGLASIKSASASPDSFGSLLLTAVAACLIGGISLYGGRGDIANIALGVLILAVLTAGLSASGAQSFAIELLTGALLLLVVTAEFVITRAIGKRKLRQIVVRAPARVHQMQNV
jgi:ribose transport system permease protein